MDDVQLKDFVFLNNVVVTSEILGIDDIIKSHAADDEKEDEQDEQLTRHLLYDKKP